METYWYSQFLETNAELINMLLLIDKLSDSVQNKKKLSDDDGIWNSVY